MDENVCVGLFYVYLVRRSEIIVCLILRSAISKSYNNKNPISICHKKILFIGVNIIYNNLKMLYTHL